MNKKLEKQFDKEFVIRPIKSFEMHYELYETIKQFIDNNFIAKEEVKSGEVSDGYHTHKELYEYRKLYNALVFSEWAKQNKYDVHKSKKHFEGDECFGGGWFVVYATTPYGQISNHYEMKDWELFKCEERQKAIEWDGHTPQDVAKTIYKTLKVN